MRGNLYHVLIRSREPIDPMSEASFLAQAFAAQNRFNKGGPRCENYSRPIRISICDRNQRNEGRALAEALRLFCESFQVGPLEPIDLLVEACPKGVKELSVFGEKRLGNLFSVSSGAWVTVHLEVNPEYVRRARNRTYFVIGGE